MTIDKELAQAASRDARRIFGTGGWWCFIGVHSWTRWEPCQLTMIYNAGIPSLEVAHEVQGQRRFCSRCGRKQLRTL